MSDDIILEHLKAIRHQLDGHGERLNRIELRLGAIKQHLGLMVASGAGDRDAVRLLEPSHRADRDPPIFVG